jgi:PHD/YefM family antitoxin component YafN of YafNO toxin-antitoxin module
LAVNVTVDQTREDWTELVDLVHGRHERVLLLHDGRPVAALVSADHLELLEQLEDAADLRAAEGALADPGNAGPPIPREQFVAELDGHRSLHPARGEGQHR